jgi:membrane associated rhomboid family serine protease
MFSAESDAESDVGGLLRDHRVRCRMVSSPGPRARPATAGLVLVCVLVFVVLWVAAIVRAEEPARAALRMLWGFDDAPLLRGFGALAGVRVWLDGEWWRVVTAGLLHGSWLHVGLNMLGLWTVGQWTEKAWGGWRQLVLFAVASVGGCLASLAWAEAPLVVGASAGIFGMAGALVVARAWGCDRVQQAVEPVSARTLGFWLAFWLGIGALLPVFGISLLAQAGHIGGLVVGVAAGYALSLAPERRLLRVVLWSSVVAGLLGLTIAAREPSGRPNYHAFMGSELLGRGEFEAAAGHFDRALEAAPEDPILANAVAYALAEAAVDLERAETLVRRSLEAEPDSADYLDTLGWVLCQQGRIDEGRTALEAAKAAASREIPEIDEHLAACGEG